MKYKFFVVDDGRQADNIPPLEVTIQIIDNVKDDNTEKIRQVLQEFYADGFNVRVMTEEEFKKNVR
ncbi:MAG: hypothetical protein LDL38_11225 [Flavobacterium piscis]|nr:hypothetical protein [Flavobacterium piscis]